MRKWIAFLALPLLAQNNSNSQKCPTTPTNQVIIWDGKCFTGSPDFTWDKSTSAIHKPFLLGTHNPDPMRLGVPAQMATVDDTGTGGWVQYAAGRGNWFALRGGSSNGTVANPTDTDLNGIVFQVDGAGYAQGKWQTIGSINFALLNNNTGPHATGQTVIWGYGTQGSDNGSLIAVDGDMGRILLGGSNQIVAMKVADTEKPPYAPEPNIVHFRVVPDGANPGFCKYTIQIGPTDQTTIKDMIPCQK